VLGGEGMFAESARQSPGTGFGRTSIPGAKARSPGVQRRLEFAEPAARANRVVLASPSLRAADLFTGPGQRPSDAGNINSTVTREDK
jgi:hypothetical protein